MRTTNSMDRVAEPAAGRMTVALLGLDHRADGPDLVAQVLERVPGVARAYVNSDTEMAYVEYNEAEATPGRVRAALEQAGLSVGDVTVRTADPPAELQEDHACCGTREVSGTTEMTGMEEAQARHSVQELPTHNRRASPTRTERGWPFRARLGLFLAAVALVLGPALWLVRPMTSDAMGADYSVNMSMTGFTPRNFSVPAGKAVSLQLNNVDSPFHGVVNGALHQFAVDKLGIDVRLDGKESTVIDLPALQPGTYEFYCNVCCGGKVNPSMQGTITVEGAEGVTQR
jgi:cytochrome c oxidase subunit 2